MPGSAPRRRRRRLPPGGLLLLASLLLAPSALAQSDLGSQRVGTSSGVFLKIPIDARAAGMAGAATALVSGPAAMFSNPAGLGLEKERAVLFSAIDYVAGIPAGGAALSVPVPMLRGSLGLALTGLFAEMDETDEYHPLGTGRRFTYNTWAAAAGFSRALTDKLSFGLALKVFHEELAGELGGPALTPWMVDAGAVYYIGYRDARIGIAVSNFGPDLRPGGTYTSHRTGSEIRYGSFSPPTMFRFAFSIDPYRGEQLATLLAVDLGHLADNQEALRVGAEAVVRGTLLLRTGYDFSADALDFHAGCGARWRISGQPWQVDYAYAHGGYFGDVHRWTLTVPW